MKHFLNKEMLAANVMTVEVDATVVARFADLEQRRSSSLSSVKPDWNSDLEWLSPSTPEAHGVFEAAFEQMGVAEHVRCYLDVDSEVRLYAGFLVIRSRCSEPHFHVDWVKTNNEAFTMLTPVTSAAREFGLLYKKLTGEIGEYEYEPGEAIIFGDHFSHSTRPGFSPDPVVLLCFEFGTDKMEHWDKIYATIGKQAAMLRRPDGDFMFTEFRGRAGY